MCKCPCNGRCPLQPIGPIEKEPMPALTEEQIEQIQKVLAEMYEKHCDQEKNTGTPSEGQLLPPHRSGGCHDL